MAISQRGKILIFSPAYFPFIGGAEVAIKEITDRISDFKFDMITALMDSKLPRIEKIGQITVYRIGIGLPKFDKLYLANFGHRLGLKLHRQNKYFAVWTSMASFGGFAALNFKLKTGVKFLLTLQEGDPVKDILHKVRFVKSRFKKIFTQADALQSISHYLNQWGRQMGFRGQIAEVIPNGVDVSKFAQEYSFEEIKRIRQSMGFEPGSQIIITASRLVNKNGIGYVIQALTELPEHVVFYICGLGQLGEKLKKLTKDLKLEKRVVFAGQKSHDELAKLFKASHIFIRPSLSEGLGNAFLEAMAASLPIIGTPVGGIPDFLVDGQTGLFCQVKNPKSIAEKIKQLLFDDQFRHKIIANGCQLAQEKYNWDNIALKMRKIFVKLRDQGQPKGSPRAALAKQGCPRAALEYSPRLIIATGIFPPDIGGPATYLEKLVVELKKQKIDLRVITYFDKESHQLYPAPFKRRCRVYDFPIIRVSRNHILLIRYFLYIWHLLKFSKDVDIIYAHDLFSCGIPAALVKKIRRKKLVIRLGGDFLWEKAIEKGWSKKPLSKYYQQPKNYQENLFLWISQRILKAADLIIFSTDFQKEIYCKNYRISREKTRVIQNPFPETALVAAPVNNQKIIFAGRLIKLKNLDFLIRVFSQVLNDQSDLQLEIIGQGPEKKNLEKLIRQLNLEKKVILRDKLPYQQLVEEINQCFLVIIPSLTEISPNLALECLKLKKPILLTQETSFYERFKDSLIFIDPFNQQDLENKINHLLDKENYLKYQEKLSFILTDYSWPEVVKQHLNILGSDPQE